jgi:ABC-type antimicrobial peptide transport system permease subunit
MGIKVLEGRDFSRDYPADTTGYILNETAVKLIGYKDPIGKPFAMDRKDRIIGVIQDFHFKSLHEPIKPMVLWFGEKKKFTGNVLVRLEAGHTQSVLQGLERLCKRINPDFPFTYKFADEQYNTLYKTEQLTGYLSKAFAFLAIFISCLGLLGLAILTAEQRTREIGIRKVLGANIASIVSLLSKDFLILVIAAVLLGSPLAWWAMEQWLHNFAYRIDIQVWMFALAGSLAVLIALITVSFQAIKAALANPVNSLRSE